MEMDEFNPNKKKIKIDYKKLSKEILEWVLCFVIAYILYLCINYFLGTVSGVKQVSMFPTAKENERLLIQRPTIFSKDVKRGDIITFEAPIDLGYIEESTTSSTMAQYKEHDFFGGFLYDFVGIGKVSYIKRVIGIEGDHILINDKGEVYVNDQKLDEPYLHEQFTGKTGQFTDLIVPKNCVFAMGDNRGESKDSRYFGCIPVKHIDGYVVCRIWPFNKMGKL
ncbi:MAG: signal peptidase I [Clostridia bacterium]|nr:signal peptidase I [Clostridia bacterium]